MESKFKVCIDEFTNMCTFLLVDMSARVSVAVVMPRWAELRGIQ